MDYLQLFRKRFIPNEMVYLKDDEIVSHTDQVMITKWKTLKPRSDIFGGISAYFFEEGYKVSKIYNSKGDIVYWYCDILNIVKDLEHNSIIFEDLLVDVIVYENGFVKVVDSAELAEALESNLISAGMVSQALRSLDALLTTIYSGNFQKLQAYINQV